MFVRVAGPYTILSRLTFSKSASHILLEFSNRLDMLIYKQINRFLLVEHTEQNCATKIYEKVTRQCSVRGNNAVVIPHLHTALKVGLLE